MALFEARHANIMPAGLTKLTLVCVTVARQACSPLFTAKQFLARWLAPQMSGAQVAARLRKDAGLEDSPDGAAHEAALVAVLGLGEGEGSDVQLGEQVTTLTAVLLGLARSARGLVLCVEDGEHIDPSRWAASLNGLTTGGATM